jgi:hypothetical protein
MWPDANFHFEDPEKQKREALGTGKDSKEWVRAKEMFDCLN